MKEELKTQFNFYETPLEGLNIVPGPSGSVMSGGASQSTNYLNGEAGWKISADGKAEFTDLFVTGFIKTVSVGQSIQAAIDFLNNHGGGQVRLDAGTHTLTDDITIYSGVSLVGAGIDNTILEFSSAVNGILMKGTSTSIKKNILLADFTLQNSNNSAGIDIDFCDYWRLENIKVTSCDQIGIRIDRSQRFFLENIQSTSNTSHGFHITGTDTRYTIGFVLRNCLAESNGGRGFFIANGTQLISDYSLLNCFSNSNTSHGFQFSTGLHATYDSVILSGCGASSNGGDGCNIISSNSGISFLGFYAYNNTGYGFRINGEFIRIIGCKSISNTLENYFFDTNSNNITFTGNEILTDASNNTLPTSKYTEVDKIVSSENNIYGSTATEKKLRRMKNVSGGSLTKGQVVVLASDSNGQSVTTTTTLGDTKVFGMVLSSSISNNGLGYILVEGYTQSLKVNGTTDIAIGDYLSCFSVAGVAQKANAGDMVFAVALEAYTTNDSNGVIDALIISPRLLPGVKNSILAATGTIDDSNATFTFTSEPSLLVINGGIYQQTGGAITWSYSAGTATLSVAVGTGGSIFGIS